VPSNNTIGYFSDNNRNAMRQNANRIGNGAVSKAVRTASNATRRKSNKCRDNTLSYICEKDYIGDISISFQGFDGIA